MSKIQALDSIEIIRRRPGMFIGETENPDHLVEEVLDNALDEITNKFASRVEIFFNQEDNSVWVTDNGRGIPVELIEVDGEKRDSVDVLFTKLFSGTKFDLDDYSTLLGQHGVGLVAVNALSDWVSVKTRDRKNKDLLHVYYFENSNLIKKTTEINKDLNYSTIVGFKPAKIHFTNLEYNTKKFAERLILTQSKFPKCNFYFNQKEIPKINLLDYVKNKLNLQTDDNLFELKFKRKENEKIQAFLNYFEDNNIIYASDVNLRSCDGTFINSFQTELKNIIKEKINKKFKSINSNEFLTGLRFYISMTVPEPKFDSQTKTRMVLNVKKNLIDPLNKNIEALISRKDIIDIIESNLERKITRKITNKTKTVRSKKVSADNKLRDCINSPGDVLYIVEGDSADGSLKVIRNKNTEASFPLKGKILNVETHNLEKISSNKEVQDLLEALGPKNNRRYKKVKILADADFDGLHISTLAILLLQKFAQDMIVDEKVSVILPPLYGATKGKQFIPVYEQKNLEILKTKGYNITRFKGLGEMNPNQLEVCIRSNIEYVVKWPETEQQLKNVVSVVTDKEVKRAIMNDNRCRFDRILNEVIQLKNNKNL